MRDIVKIAMLPHFNIHGGGGGFVKRGSWVAAKHTTNIIATVFIKVVQILLKEISVLLHGLSFQFFSLAVALI